MGRVWEVVTPYFTYVPMYGNDFFWVLLGWGFLGVGKGKGK